MKNLTTVTLTLDSREAAQMIGKEHRHLLRDIDSYSRYLTETKIGLSDFWQESTYKDITGRTLKNYQITRKGCEFIAHKLTGKKGAIFTATYINKFHEMEQRIQNLPTMARIPKPMQKLTYKGMPVITTRILSEFTGVMQGTIVYQAKFHKICYELLIGAEVRAFAKENNLSHYSASKTVIFTKEAATLLLLRANILTDKLKVRLNEYFALVPLANPMNVVKRQLLHALPQIKPKKLYVSIPDEPKIIAAVAEIRKRMTALDVMFSKYMMYHEEQNVCGLKKALVYLACDVASETMQLTDLKYQLVERPGY